MRCKRRVVEPQPRKILPGRLCRQWRRRHDKRSIGTFPHRRQGHRALRATSAGQAASHEYLQDRTDSSATAPNLVLGLHWSGRDWTVHPSLHATASETLNSKFTWSVSSGCRAQWATPFGTTISEHRSGPLTAARASAMPSLLRRAGLRWHARSSDQYPGQPLERSGVAVTIERAQ